MDSIEKRLSEELRRFDSGVVEEEDTIWLLSYADLMTLMFTFFLMLYSAAAVDEGTALRKTLASYLQGNGDGNGMATGGLGDAGDGGGHTSIEDIKKSLSARIQDEQLLKDVKVEINNRGLDITFSSSLLFDIGSTKLRPEAMAVLTKVVTTLKDRAPHMKIRVEGHTDDNPMVTGRFSSNWELSVTRAAHIVEFCEKQGFPPENILAVGYGSSRPAAPNRTPAGLADLEGQRKNRRVVLTVYELKKDTSNPNQL